MPIPQDPNLRSYVAFEHDDDRIHRSHEAVFYYLTSESLDETKIFLLMPAGEDDLNTWYYVFTTDPEAHACWNIEGDDDKLKDASFSGDDHQRFAIVADGDHILIKHKASGQYLLKSDHLMDAHHPIRRGKLPDASSDDRGKYRFKLHLLTDRPVAIPTLRDTGTVEPGKLPDPPAPTRYGDRPDEPDAVFIGEDLVPFFMVPTDPTVQGDLRMWQVGTRPYYVLRREQQWQWDPNATINMTPDRETDGTITVACGLTEKTIETMEDTIGMTFGVNKGTKASVGFKGVSIEASKGFQASFQRTLKVTTTSESDWSVNVTKTITVKALSVTEETTTIPWQLCDLWTLVYDGKNSEHWGTGSELLLPLCYPSTVQTQVS